jgi:hypothetical protein
MPTRPCSYWQINQYCNLGPFKIANQVLVMLLGHYCQLDPVYYRGNWFRFNIQVMTIEATGSKAPSRSWSQRRLGQYCQLCSDQYCQVRPDHRSNCVNNCQPDSDHAVQSTGQYCRPDLVHKGDWVNVAKRSVSILTSRSSSLRQLCQYCNQHRQLSKIANQLLDLWRFYLVLYFGRLTWLRLFALACWMLLLTESRDSRLFAPRIGEP